MGSHPWKLMLILHILSRLFRGKYRLMLKRLLWKQVTANNQVRRGVVLPSVQSLCFLVQTILARKLMKYNNNFLKIWSCTFAKGTRAFQVVKMFGLRRLILRQCTHVIFLFHFDLVEEVLVVEELCLFRTLFVISTACVDPLVWLHIQEI